MRAWQHGQQTAREVVASLKNRLAATVGRFKWNELSAVYGLDRLRAEVERTQERYNAELDRFMPRLTGTMNKEHEKHQAVRVNLRRIVHMTAADLFR